MRSNAVVLAAALIVAPLTARGADLVVWWETGFYPQENEAVADIVTAFEQETGKQVELVQYGQGEIMKQAEAALRAGAPPDFLFSTVIQAGAARWAYEDRLADLRGALTPVLDLFDADTIEVSTLINSKTGRRGLYALPIGRSSNHIHVWLGVLEQAGFSLADIPREWEPFWTFWCDRVQPAVRKALGRENIWAVGLAMSTAATDTYIALTQFQLAYQASWLGPDRRIQIDDTAVRKGMIKAMSAYTEIWRKGCTPPDSVTWTDLGNNQAFLAQTVVMTVNGTLSIPAALKRDRPDDYYRNAATIDWPAAVNGEPLALHGFVYRAVVFKAGGHGATAERFVRFLADEGWLAHWLSFAGDRLLPPMRRLVDQPFWLDPSDPHRMRGAIQIMTQPQLMVMEVRDNEWRSGPIFAEKVWGKAVHRVVTENISPEQAVDEAIARIKEILAE